MILYLSLQNQKNPPARARAAASQPEAPSPSHWQASSRRQESTPSPRSTSGLRLSLEVPPALRFGGRLGLSDASPLLRPERDPELMYANMYKEYGHTTAALGGKLMSTVDWDSHLLDFFNVRVMPYKPDVAHDQARRRVAEILNGPEDCGDNDVDGRIKLALAALEAFTDSVEALNILAWSHMQKAHACQLQGRSECVLFRV